MDTLGMLSRQSMMIVDAHIDAKVQLEEVFCQSMMTTFLMMSHMM